MIQRKQTLFLLLALIITVICLCLPVATLAPQGMGVDMPMYNLWVVDANGGHQFSVWVLFAILLVTCPLALIAIFLFKNRKAQIKLCVINILFMLCWYSVYAFHAINLGDKLHASFQLEFAAGLPFFALIFYFLALRGVRADEALIKSMDRIR